MLGVDEVLGGRELQYYIGLIGLIRLIGLIGLIRLIAIKGYVLIGGRYRIGQIRANRLNWVF